MKTTLYRVRIIYEERLEQETKQRHIDWNCEAFDADEARIIAGAHFDRLARVTGAKPPRRLKSYEVTPIDPQVSRIPYATATLTRFGSV